MIALAQRLVASKGWRWLPGMMAHHPNWRTGRVSHVGLTAVRVACRYPSPMGGTKWSVPLLPITDLLPDLSDPLTVQALLLLVREAWATETAWVEPGHDGLWEACVYVGGECRFLESYDSEAETLVAALEAAP